MIDHYDTMIDDCDSEGNGDHNHNDFEDPFENTQWGKAEQLVMDDPLIFHYSTPDTMIDDCDGGDYGADSGDTFNHNYFLEFVFLSDLTRVDLTP